MFSSKTGIFRHPRRSNPVHRGEIYHVLRIPLETVSGSLERIYFYGKVRGKVNIFLDLSSWSQK